MANLLPLGMLLISFATVFLASVANVVIFLDTVNLDGMSCLADSFCVLRYCMSKAYKNEKQSDCDYEMMTSITIIQV